MTDFNPLPGWYRDPTGFGDGRYWDGQVWTNSVSRAGQTITAHIDPEQAAVPPVPGSELQGMAPLGVVSAPRRPPSRSPIGAIIGILGVIAIVVLIVVLVNNDGDSSNGDSPPATTPPATEAPAEPTAEGG